MTSLIQMTNDVFARKCVQLRSKYGFLVYYLLKRFKCFFILQDYYLNLLPFFIKLSGHEPCSFN